MFPVHNISSLLKEKANRKLGNLDGKKSFTCIIIKHVVKYFVTNYYIIVGYKNVEIFKEGFFEL
jgi:hypothetical protein